jgi:DNA-binding winged helix-turn-helix (wHTH) protein
MDTRFGEFRFDAATRQLFRAGVELPLSPKAFELLRLLIEHRPRALSKSELQQLLWPATFVSEGNLPLLVSQIRAALGDTASGARFVRTVHRFGYAFCGSVIEPAIARPSALVADPMCWIAAGTRRVPLCDGDHVLGRDPEAAVWVNTSGVSRHHARIRVSGAMATIEDLDSKNGTFVRSERITGVIPLNDGDEIRLGLLVLLTFRIESPAGTTETQGTASEHR